MRRLIARIALLGIVGAMGGGVRPDMALADDPMADLPFAVGSEGGVFGEAHNDGRQGQAGRWEVLRGRLDLNALHLTVRLNPAAHGLPVRSGPAVLFGAFHLYGDAGGDVATGATVDSLTAVTLAPCVDAACQYETEIALPTHDLPAALKRLAANGRLIWVSAEFTLVRTFGQGTWLQVIPFDSDDAPIDAGAGVLGNVKPAAGRLFPFGLFPATQSTPLPDDPAFPGGLKYGDVVEKRRLDAGDTTAPLSTVDAALHVDLPRPCDGAQVLTIHTASGDRILSKELLGLRSIDERIELPMDVRWWLTLHDGGGIDFDQGRSGWGTRVGPIQSVGGPLTIEATFDCVAPRGAVRVGPDAGGPDVVETSPAADTPHAGNRESPAWMPGLLAVLIAVAAATGGLLVRKRRA